MRVLPAIRYQSVTKATPETVCLGITPRQADILYPLKGIECFATFAEASLWLIMNRTPKDALVLASIGEHGGFSLLGIRYL